MVKGLARAGHPGHQGRRQGAAPAAAARRQARRRSGQFLAALEECSSGAGAWPRVGPPIETRDRGGRDGDRSSRRRRWQRDEQREEGRAGVLGGPRHLDHHPLDQGELRRRRDHRLLRRRGPGRRPRGRAQEGPRHRRLRSASSRTCARSSSATTPSRRSRPGAVYEDNYLLGTALARPLLAYRQVQAAPSRGGRRAGPRRHRQGQRPGPLRGDLRRLRAPPHGHRPLARVGHPLPRGRARLRRRARRARGPVAARPLQPRRQPLAPLPRGRQPRGHLERAAEGDVQAHGGPAGRAGQARRS